MRAEPEPEPEPEPSCSLTLTLPMVQVNRRQAERQRALFIESRLHSGLASVITPRGRSARRAISLAKQRATIVDVLLPLNNFDGRVASGSVAEARKEAKEQREAEQSGAWRWWRRSRTYLCTARSMLRQKRA